MYSEKSYLKLCAFLPSSHVQMLTREQKERTIICWSNNKGPIFEIKVNVFPFSFFPPYAPLFLTLFHTFNSHQAWGRREVRFEMDPWKGRGDIYWRGKGDLTLMTSLRLRVAGVSVSSLHGGFRLIGGWQGRSPGVFARGIRI